MKIMWAELVVTFITLLIPLISADNDDSLSPPGAVLVSSSSVTTMNRYAIEGRVYPPDYIDNNDIDTQQWLNGITIQLNGGESIAFVKPEGYFTIWGAPGGSHVIQVLHPEYAYEPIRVEINSKGKFRARKLNHVQTSLVIQVPYPLRMKPIGKYKYFQLREQWRITDFLFNPMILMMVLPFLIIMILPKMMNDPETKKEMEQLGNLTKMRDMPEMSEYFASIFGKTPPKPAPSKSNKVTKKRQ